jgi:tetratricopeptide (TPR) repeat protein
MAQFDPQELREMTAYGLSEVVDPGDEATIAELLRLHGEYAALDEDEHRFEHEELGPALAFSLFDLGVPDPARDHIQELLEEYDRTEDERLLWALGYAYIRVKQYALGERWYRHALRDAPSKAIAAYNLACNFSMRAREAERPLREHFREEALEYLRLAIEEYNYGDWKWMEEDGDLDFIRKEPGYRELLRKLQERYPEREKGKVPKSRSSRAPR